MSEERGPSWYDVSKMAEALREEYRCAVEFRVVPPVKRLDGRGYTSWSGRVTATPLGEDAQPKHWVDVVWGQGGKAKTAPAALYVGLLDVCDWLEQRKLAAERQASF